MKIIFALTIYETGGVSTVARNLMDCFSTDGVDVVLLTEKLSHTHYPIGKRLRVINLDILSKKGFFAKAFNIARHIKSIRKCIAKERPDIIISFGAYINCHILLSLLFGLSKKPKIILTEHSEEMFLKVIKYENVKRIFFKIVYKMLMLFLYPRADYIVTVSKNIELYMKKLYLVSPRRVRTIYNPINIDRIKELCTEDDSLLNFNDPLPCVGTISRLSPEKGIRFLIKGFEILLDRTDARLIIIGDGAERLYLEQMARDIKIEKKVIFTGFVDNPFKYLAKIDTFVLPSLWEGFPNVLLEAMACRVPVVVSNSAGGVREVIKNRVNGLLIEPGSASAISDSVYALLSDNRLRENIIKEAYETVKQFDIVPTKKQYENLIFDLIER